MKSNRILLVDDDDQLREMYQQGLERHGFEVVPAASVNRALSLIVSEKFDVLMSDLHMPDPGDGLTVVSAMRHTQPSAVTLLVSGHPALREAMDAICSQADEVLVKPLGVAKVIEVVNNRLTNRPPRGATATNKERAASILEQERDSTIQGWMSRVEGSSELTAIPLTPKERSGHLPLLLGDIVYRLRLSSTNEFPSSGAARMHGVMRHIQGYTAAMIVEESRLLQASIFNTLQCSLERVDFDYVLLDVMSIADECESQLKQAILGFVESQSAKPSRLPV